MPTNVFREIVPPFFLVLWNGPCRFSDVLNVFFFPQFFTLCSSVLTIAFNGMKKIIRCDSPLTIKLSIPMACLAFLNCLIHAGAVLLHICLLKSYHPHLSIWYARISFLRVKLSEEYACISIFSMYRST